MEKLPLDALPDAYPTLLMKTGTSFASLTDPLGVNLGVRIRICSKNQICATLKTCAKK
jgi:hypothetical protein